VSNPIAPSGVIFSVRTGQETGAAAVSDLADFPAGLASAPGLHSGLLVLDSSPVGARPPAGLLADEGAARWPAPDLPAPTRVHPFEPAARGLKAAAASLPTDRPAPGSEALAPPRGFGLISDALPLFQVSLECAFDRFLTGIKDLGAGSSNTHESSDRWIPWLVLTATAGLGAAARVRWQHCAADAGEEPGAPGPEGRLGRHGLPGFASAH
jgi:hypothetical protein